MESPRMFCGRSWKESNFSRRTNQKHTNCKLQIADIHCPMANYTVFTSIPFRLLTERKSTSAFSPHP